jgi:hypothetical protein
MRDESPERHRARAALEARVRLGKATPKERAEVLTEAIDALAYAYGMEMEAGSRKSVSAVVQLLALVAVGTMVVSIGMCFQVKPDPATKWVAAVSSLVGVPLVALVVFRSRRDGRAVARGFMRPLARSLRHVRPTTAELDEALASLAMAGNALAAELSGAELHRRIAAEALKV